MSCSAEPSPAAIAQRRRAMAAFAAAEAAELDAVLTTFAERDSAIELRRPEAGLVMLRGRIGGDGAAFNLGEATVARAALRLASGEVGHAYVLGRDPMKARLAALADALWQKPATRARIEAELVAPVEARLAAAAALAAARTQATKVDFFTMVRGED